jgi:hypothetical protein
MRTDEANRLKGVVHGVGLRLVTIDAEAIAKNDRRDAMLLEERNEVGSFGSHPQNLMPAAGCHDHGCAGIRRIIAGKMNFNRRVVNVDDVERFVDLAFERRIVPLRFVNPLQLQPRRIGWPQRQYHSAREDRLRHERRGVCRAAPGGLKGDQKQRQRADSNHHAGRSRGGLRRLKRPL